MRALRGTSCSIENISLARKIGFPLRTRSGPPPIASVTSLQLGVSVSRIVSGVPAGASPTSFAPPVPRPTITAPPGGIVVPPFVGPICATRDGSSTPGVVGGSEGRTASVTPAICGVVGPHAGVNRLTPFAPGTWFSRSGRRWPLPRQTPSYATRSTRSVPSAAMPMLERWARGGESRTPERMRMLDGSPPTANRSPFTPATVAAGESFFSIAVSFSRPRMTLFESAGRSV